MCGAPANTHGWINSGTQNNVILSNLPPNTLFYYSFGSPGQVSLQGVVDTLSGALGNCQIWKRWTSEPAGHRQYSPGQLSYLGALGRRACRALSGKVISRGAHQRLYI